MNETHKSSKTPRITLTTRQLEDTQKFKTDLKKGNVKFVFKGTILESLAFLGKGKNSVESFHH